MLYDSRSTLMVLGNLMLNPDLLISNNIEITNEDFPERFHKFIFSSIKKLYTTGVKEITPMDIDGFLANYKAQYKCFEDNNGLEWLEQAIELCDKNNYEYHLLRIKKYTILRKLQADNFNINEIYDEDNEEIIKQFNDMTLEEIINHYNKKLIEIERDISKIENGTHVSYEIDELLDELKKHPTMGLDCGINSLNYYIYGLRKKYYLISAKTGEGKTRLQAYFALQVGYYQKIPCLFISTEVPLDEIQTLFISCIAKVDERKILLNDLTNKERARINYAKEELKKSKIDVVYMPDFTLETIEHTIKRYILTKQISYCFFDYIKESITMIEGMTKRVGKIDGWKALNLFSEKLKVLCEKYKIGIVSATQLSKDGFTSGSGAIPNAVDVWLKLKFVNSEEKQKYDLMDFGKETEILCLNIEKNRRGMKDFQVYLECNLGQLKFEEILAIKGDIKINVPIVKFN